jgi:hypothetical protein
MWRLLELGIIQAGIQIIQSLSRFSYELHELNTIIFASSFKADIKKEKQF